MSQVKFCEADLVLLNGKIYTVDVKNPWVEALACYQGRIIAIGNSSEIRAFAGRRTRTIDLKGAFACPGFNDAHVDFYRGGLSLQSVDLRECATRDAFASEIKKYVENSASGEWVLEGNWNHENWPEKTFPNKELIDPFTNDKPVFICRSDEHVSLANSLALRLAGITKDSHNPDGGEIFKHPDTGEPTGILVDKAQELVSRVIPEPAPQDVMKTIQVALEHAAQFGITSIQDNTSLPVLKTYQQLLKRNELTVRVNAWRPVSCLDSFEEIGLQQCFGSNMLRTGVVKLFADGSMGAGSALFYEPYTDNPGNAGLAMYSEEELTDLVIRSDAAGLQCAVHAIGDLANNIVLNAFEKACDLNPSRVRRHRIEHLQVIGTEDLDRVKNLKIVASVQPTHFLDDIPWAEQRIGASRVRHLYLWRSLVERDIDIAFGTDWPVASLNPLKTLYAAVSRNPLEPVPEVNLFPEEKIGLEKALECQTLGSAYAEYGELVKGSLEIGKLADIVVLSNNLFETNVEEFLNTKVNYTILGGRIIYSGIDHGN